MFPCFLSVNFRVPKNRLTLTEGAMSSALSPPVFHFKIRKSLIITRVAFWGIRQTAEDSSSRKAIRD